MDHLGRTGCAQGGMAETASVVVDVFTSGEGMTNDRDFGPGSYGDYSGLCFYGPPTNGFWFTEFGASFIYLEPLFRAIFDRARVSRTPVPKLVEQWNQCKLDADEIIEVPAAEISDLLAALSKVTAADLESHCCSMASNTGDCLSCASHLAQFLNERLAKKEPVFFEEL
jgi:hypothetical protein